MLFEHVKNIRWVAARILRILPYTVGKTFIPSVIVDVLETLGGASTVLPLFNTLPLHPPDK